MLLKTYRAGGARRRRRARSGKILVLLAIMLPSLCAVAALTVDLSMLQSSHQHLQQITDAAATAAAREYVDSGDKGLSAEVARSMVQQLNGMADATVQVNHPPLSGPYAGSPTHLEVICKRQADTYFASVFGGPKLNEVTTRAVAGIEATTSNAAIMVLDPDPPNFQLGALTPLLPPLPALLGGFEVLGAGRVDVEGAVLVNTEFGGRDERGRRVGRTKLPPYAVASTPLLPLSGLRAKDIYVVGGVDNPLNYGTLGGGPSCLKCNRFPSPDPFAKLSPPTLGATPQTSATSHGGKTVIGLPLLGPPVTLRPGVYDYIEVVSGIAIFEPGVYVIRGKHPLTQISLQIVAGTVVAEGVMFYITDSPNYAIASGAPDVAKMNVRPPANNLITLLPSTLINIGLLNSKMTGLNAPGTPYDGMLIYQARTDRRPIVLVQEGLLLPGTFKGTVYSKWGHVILVGANADLDARFVVGTMRIVTVLNTRISPKIPLPPAYDVYLKE